MPCYIWRNKDGEITAYDQTADRRPSPAIEVSIEEFKKLGFYREPTSSTEPVNSVEDPQTPASALLIGINSV